MERRQQQPGGSVGHGSSLAAPPLAAITGEVLVDNVN
jgi:hypothetical protein